MFRWKRGTSPTCPHCGLADQDEEHLVLHCPVTRLMGGWETVHQCGAAFRAWLKEFEIKLGGPLKSPGVKAVTSDISMNSLTSDVSMVSLTSSQSQTDTSTTTVVQQPPSSSESSSSSSSANCPSSSSSFLSTSSSFSTPQLGKEEHKNNSAVSGGGEGEGRDPSIDDVTGQLRCLGIPDENDSPGESERAADHITANPTPMAGTSDHADDAGAVGGAMEGAMGGATGGSQRPVTVDDFLKMQGAQQMFAVTPLSWCPHLTELQPMPTRPLNCGDPCSVCGDTSENWVCLVCHKVACSRFVNEHMLFHRLETEHNLTLSYSDISVWCYACDHYVDNQVLQPMKNAAHVSKFGESLPGFQ